MLQHRVRSALKREFVDDEKWVASFRKTWKQLAEMETYKHQPPKYCEMCEELAVHIGEEIKPS